MGKFSDLPGEIMLDIFTRLPVESVLDCKLVSKTCRTVLQHPSFVKLHSNRLLLSNPDSIAVSGKLSFILKMRDVSEPYSKGLYYLEYDAEVCSHRLRKLKLNPPLHFIYGVIGSCNGLVCIIGLPKHHTLDTATSSACVVYISNPITRECVTLEELDRATHYHPIDFVLYGFGYVASTNEYKVVRLYTFWREDEDEDNEDEDKFAQVEVYTLGSGKGWRKAGNINVGSALFGRQHAEFVNGFLHWDLLKGKTVAFDLANEVFVGYSEFQNGRLWCGVLGGYFCGTLYSEDKRNSDIWVLKKKKDESFTWSWSQEFSLTDTDPYTTSLALTSSGTVLCYSETKLYLYDLESSSFKMLVDLGREILNKIPHMNSLVSLRAFGEDNTRTLEFGESAEEDLIVEDWWM